MPSTRRCNTSTDDRPIDRPVSETRLSKHLAERGLCSRREADHYIEQGLVRVNGKVVREAYYRVADGDRVELDAAARERQSARVTVLLNKPLGYVSAQPEKGYRSAATLVNPGNYFGEGAAPRISSRGTLAPAGRLDINSTGLLVLTQDGRVARRLIGNNANIEKEYLVRHRGAVSDTQIGRLRHGLSLDGRKLKRANVERINDSQLRFVLVEGRKRQIRRMCDLVGVEVAALKRVRIGGVVLGNLPPGKWRLLSTGEQF
ncbi:MAG: rRNA pseudouridine synthase [Proteobacteria bacterium]|nr:MAG: rRNA pseudouridine synthase [Pseudomonadota bacterium]